MYLGFPKLCFDIVLLIQGDDIGRVGRSSKIVERMVNQNTFDEIAQGLCLHLLHINHVSIIILC